MGHRKPLLTSRLGRVSKIKWRDGQYSQQKLLSVNSKFGKSKISESVSMWIWHTITENRTILFVDIPSPRKEIHSIQSLRTGWRHAQPQQPQIAWEYGGSGWKLGLRDWHGRRKNLQWSERCSRSNVTSAKVNQARDSYSLYALIINAMFGNVICSR